MNNTTHRFLYIFILPVIILISGCRTGQNEIKTTSEDNHPRFVNIINFIRLLEPRYPAVTEDVLYQTVVSQIDMMKRYDLGGTFLVQYDALMDQRYQKLLKSLPDSAFEIGAWWEIPQPLVEKAGLEWRGRYPWDWHADVGFSTGYSPEEREKLVDAYMNDFMKVFGYYPRSVGCWFLDAHTLKYMFDKYKIVASCICRDQIGTDGYTLWGGYWNQGYYPSIYNSYMPAQNEKNQIPVPVFRMLGSDPIRQYDSRAGSNGQGVITLEPSYKNGGGDSIWVNWYFKEFVEGECINYAYVQAGQENSFTWESMSEGYAIQLPLVAQLRDEKKVNVETLSETGKWFQEHFKTTPPTAVTIKEDLPGSNYKTIWFNSRYYRVNLFWDNNRLRIRDIHLFNENFKSPYLQQKGTSESCAFFTLPFVDGHQWSSDDTTAGLILRMFADGEEIIPEGDDFIADDTDTGKLKIIWPVKTTGTSLTIIIDEKRLFLSMNEETPVKWFFELTASDEAELPFGNIGKKQINCSYSGMTYFVTAIKGNFQQLNNNRFRIEPEDNQLELDFSGEN